MVIYNLFGLCSCITYFARTYRQAKDMFWNEFKDEPVGFRRIELLY